MANLPHTPTPWTPHNGNARTVASVLPGGSVPVAVFSNATDADFAMLAANCHDDLVMALGATIGNMLNAKIALDVGDTKSKVAAQLASAIKSAENALARAKGDAS